MKELFAGVVLILVIGIGAFAYRSIMEHPLAPTGPVATACTLEAKVCPDGTSVGRSGPSCAFAPCPPPNVEISISTSTVAFVLPPGYAQLEQGAPGQETLRIYQKPTSLTAAYHVITISRYLIPQGGSASSIMLAKSIKGPSGMAARSMSELTPVIINGKTFYTITLERFEGQVETAYYFPRTADVLRFDLIERGVNNWTDPKLVVASLPEHQAFLTMLGTLQSP